MLVEKNASRNKRLGKNSFCRQTFKWVIGQYYFLKNKQIFFNDKDLYYYTIDWKEKYQVVIGRNSGRYQCN